MAGSRQAAETLEAAPSRMSGASPSGGAAKRSDGPAEGRARSAAEESQVRCARIAVLDASITALTAERGALLVAERDSEVWKASGFSSFESWRGHMSGEGARTAKTQISVATVLVDSAETSVALAAGEVTLVHAQVLGRIRKAAERTSAGALSPDDQAALLDLAREEDADAFSKTADRWLARRDSVTHDASHEDIRRRRYLTISTTAGGTHIKGFLDAVAGHTLQVAIDAAMTRPGADDDRDYDQRRADALIDVAEVAVAGGTLKTGALVRPHISLIMTESTFVEARRELRRRAGSSAGTDTASAGRTERPGLVEPATFEDGTPVPLNELARILCDAQITRIVMDADDAPINLGRTARLYSGEQRRAIIARDRHCQFRGCTQRSRWCEVHHIEWWDRDDGETSIANGILLCNFHHHEVHRGNVTITPDQTGAMVVSVAHHQPSITSPGPGPGPRMSSHSIPPIGTVALGRRSAAPSDGAISAMSTAMAKDLTQTTPLAKTMTGCGSAADRKSAACGISPADSKSTGDSVIRRTRSRSGTDHVRGGHDPPAEPAPGKHQVAGPRPVRTPGRWSARASAAGDEMGPPTGVGRRSMTG